MKLPEAVIADFKHLDTYMLFGSRAMALREPKEHFDPAIMIGAQIDLSTDWDFAVPASAENHDALIAAGYKHITKDNLYYVDDMTAAVYTKTYNSKHKVQVVFKNDYAIFRQVWYSIDVEFYYKYIWKRGYIYDFMGSDTAKKEIRDVMNQLFNTARQML